MNIPTPIQLNFVNQLNVFQEIKFYDDQYRIQVKRHDTRKVFDSNDTKDKISPLWELEKKLLLWTFLGHKHLDSVLLLGRMNEKVFLRDVCISLYEYKLAKPERFFGNLVQRGYATWEDTDDGRGIKINRKGRLVGVMITFTQLIEREEDKDDAGIRHLKWRKLGWSSYQLLLISTYLLLLLSVALLASTFLSSAHLTDDVVQLFRPAFLLITAKVFLLLYVSLSVLGFVVSIILIYMNRILVMKELARRDNAI